LLRQLSLACGGFVGAVPGKASAFAIMAAAIIFLLFALHTNHEIAAAVGDQLTQEESAFCRRLGAELSVQFDACMREVSRLVQREREIRTIEF
jgi:hypothetical protein